MDASASPQVPEDFNKVCGFFFKIENSAFPVTPKQKNTIIKYTKLPDFDFDASVNWPLPETYTLKPRLRRIVALDDQIMKAPKSLRNDVGTPLNFLPSGYTKRKIVTIVEDEESGDPNSKPTKNINKLQNTLQKVIEPSLRIRDSKSQKSTSTKSMYRFSSPKSFIKEDTEIIAKTNTSANKKEETPASKKNKIRNINYQNKPAQDNTRSRVLKEREIVRNVKISTTPSKTSLKKVVAPSESDKKITLIKNKLRDDVKNNVTSRTDRSRLVSTPTPRSEKPKMPPMVHKTKSAVLKEVKAKYQPVTVIHVPLDDKYEKGKIPYQPSEKKDSSTECIIPCSNMNVGTDPEPERVEKVTDIQDFHNETTCYEASVPRMDSSDHHYYDSLDIPNVTLLKEKNYVPKEDFTNFYCRSLPNLKMPTLKITSQMLHNEKNNNENDNCNNTSFIIGRATVTYTTKQKIDIHMVGNNEENSPNVLSSPLAYPMNVVSVFKKDIKNKRVSSSTPVDNTNRKKGEEKEEFISSFNEIKSFNCSYVYDSSKLVKPSDIISAIRINNGMLQSDYICEQFQRELNFIDSFFESLQYLESCSLSDKCLSEGRVENWVSNSSFDIRNQEYDSLFSKIDTEANIDDTETMASKSLCLLNLLIRDEQRRAKNLLFVLKMREDALKDFTKSQILWLENKKKQDNTDIPTLKKKQRGALLKLQHECGEMQRMRKALLALSEKRKIALMKTKKNIELKLNNNVDQIFLGKKKLKRNTLSDRNVAPLKCFDLSSSGCEDSTTSRAKSDAGLVISATVTPAKSAEKCIQTGDSLVATVQADKATDTAGENFVGVDGCYLNILFGNLSLPQIFSSGKQYEVNEEALKNIVVSANMHHSDIHENDIVDKLLNQIKTRDEELSTSPSTARSLVEELDQYYKGLAEDCKSPIESPERRSPILDSNIISLPENNQCENDVHSFVSTTHSKGDKTLPMPTTNSFTGKPCECDGDDLFVETQVLNVKDSVITAIQAGPLSVPTGAAALNEPTTTDLHCTAGGSPLKSFSACSSSTVTDSSDSSLILGLSASSLSSLVQPVHYEAEELRRQQLAIEREIKALEQAQCQLLVVREIPDKPPPPYTPPTESKPPKLPRKFVADDAVEEKIRKHLNNPSNTPFDACDAFDGFLKDFCDERLEIQKSESSDKPWDACNLLPQKSQLNMNELGTRTSLELQDILTAVTPTIVSGVGARRSDHIDDILFAEWRRCEPEWTAHHVDEAVVKTQIFESIFQRILTDTIDEYKRTVLGVHNRVKRRCVTNKSLSNIEL